MAQSDRLLIAQLDVSIRSLERSMRKAGIVTDQMTDKMEKRWDRMNRRVTQNADQMGRDVRRAIAGVAIGLAGREVTQYADQWVNLNNKLAAASQVSGMQARSLLELQQQAAETRSEIEPYADLYTRILRASEGLVEGEAEVARITQLTAKAFQAGGAAASEQAAGVLQLGQALGSGLLQGDELRSLRENAPLVAKAIADFVGVSIGELKDLGAEGKLTSKIVADAILAAGDDIEAAFAVTTPRATDAARLAFDRLKLSVGEYLTETGAVAKASEALADVIDFVADNVDAFADSIVIAGTALAGWFGGAAVGAVVTGLSSVATGATAAARAM